jgi:ligand-binding sensor domain-containing protein/serine phosphatase RsbU (regulator of sigma subunit)
MRKTVTLILLILSLILQASQHRITHFTGYKVLEESYVYSVVQDSLGFLWISTSNGVFRHDGINFDYYNHDELVNDNFISASIYHKGKVWLGHRGGNLTSIVSEEFTPVILTEESISGIVSFAIDKANFLWAGTYSDGIFRITENDKVERFAFSEDISLQNFVFDAHNILLLGTDEGLKQASIASDSRLVVTELNLPIPEAKIISIIPTANKRYIIGTEENGIYLLEYYNIGSKVDTLLTAAEVDSQMLASMLFDSSGNLWLGTMGNGLVKINNILSESKSDKIVQWFSNETSGFIKTLYADRDENIWIGNYGEGITRLSKNPFSWNEFEIGHNSGNLLAVTSNRNYRWLAHENILQCFDKRGGTIVSFNKSDGMPSGISSLLVGADDNLWIGTNGNGLYKLSIFKGEFKRIRLPSGVLENTITTLCLADSHIWVGTRKGVGRIKLHNQEVDWFTIRKGGLPHNVINHVYVGTDKKVWITTQSNTITTFENNEFKRIELPLNNGLSILNAVTSDEKGQVWITSHGMGVFRFSGDSLINLREQEGLYSNYCYGIQPDNNGYMWITHRGGISRVHVDVLSVRSIQDYAGIRENDDFGLNSFASDGNGKLWFGTPRGVLSYSRDLENINMLSPKLNLISLRANGFEKELNRKLKLPYGRYKLKFDFIGISLKEPQKVKYQYRLSGYDEEWSTITTETSAVFNNIGFGRYVFEVNASSSDGVSTTEPLRLDVLIRKPLWIHWWFYVLIFSLGLTFIYAILKRREYKLLQANIKLEERVAERTNEIQRQKDEIQRQGEVIRKKNVDITDSMKYARTIQSAIFPPEDILESALPEYFLINKPKDIVSGDFCWYTKSDNKYVIAVTDCTGHGVPGSIMSMLGITLFNEVVNNLGITDSAEILEIMREKVVSALNQHKKENPSYDGMNVGLCVLDNNSNSLQFSGAFHNLVHIHKGEVKVIKAERTPIGYTPLDRPVFKAHDINYNWGDMFYMFSDGYQDQFGGEDDRKYTAKRLLKVLHEIHHKPMNDQQYVLEQTLSSWMMGQEQTDDIILLGFRL